MKDSSLILKLLHPALRIKRSDNNQRNIFDDWTAVPITVDPCQAISDYASQNLRVWANSKKCFKDAVNAAFIAQFDDANYDVEITDNHVDPYSSQCEITLKDRNTGDMAIFVFELQTSNGNMIDERS